ncbi:Signal transduction histidine kinase [Microterricola viridarii]|uniref:Signal transduction histidine kinase n=1 Tax=Microterricola viridarii TaxID=412690 RepID=A0A1H1Z202_9MICO|nr:Signal transduction histidine kinase [Microterricola viridarii]
MVGALCDPRLQTVTEYSPPGAFRPSRLRLHPGPTHLRLMRMTAGAVGLAGLVFGILAIGPFVEQHQHEMRPLAVLSFAVLVGLPVAIGLWGSWAPLPVLMTLAALESVVLPLVLVAWPLTHGDASIQSDGIPWPLGISALPIVCLALIARGAFVWGYLGLIGALTVYVMFVSNGAEEALLLAVQTGLYAASFSSIFVGLVLVGLQSAERLDLLQAGERVGAARNAARAAREGERARFDGLIHDGVLSTLLMAGRADQLHGDHVRQARNTLAQMERIASGTSATGVLSAERVIFEMRRLASQHSVHFVVEVGEETTIDDLRLPAEVVEALLAAGGEAMRNSNAHAAGRQSGVSALRQPPRRVERRAELWLHADVVVLGVRDDGVGFDPERVRPERMGVARSIVGRMNEVQGGYAVVDSRPGRGTLVTLGWLRR